MIFGITAAPIPAALPYAEPVAAACGIKFPPLFAYAIACRESILGEMQGLWPSAARVVSEDEGHGLMQLTSEWPDDWENPQANVAFALRNFLIPDLLWWRYRILGLSGDDLVRCVAASYNAGRSEAWRGHEEGNVDLYTTDDYGAGVLAIFHNLLTKGTPR